MSDTRTPRDLNVREKKVRQWQQPSLLPTPTAEPGYGYRWVMTHLLGENQPTNVSQRIREGYEPVKAADHPEMGLPANAAGNIEIGGLMLCKMPEEMLRQRADFYENQANTQATAVKSKFLGNSDSRMPAFAETNSRSSRGNFGSGSI